MKIPNSLSQVLATCYKDLFPQVNNMLSKWRDYANQIPNEELRTQALASIDSKTFHCEGGSIYATLAREKWQKAIDFIVSYQTISDYLDNLCDRSQSLDPVDFRQLHQAQLDAIRIEPEIDQVNYYKYRDDQDDQGYLKSLVLECQRIIKQIPNYDQIQPYIERLASLYVDLQVHKHVVEHERVYRLTEWFEHENEDEDLRWYEFSAATGSTLGVFCLISYGLANEQHGRVIQEAFFPSLQGLHILLDYFIDQHEDEVEGDLNFVNYYQDENEKLERMAQMIKQARQNLTNIPDQNFHQLIVDGLVGLYLSDPKVKQIKTSDNAIKYLLQSAGWRAKIVYWNGKAYRKFKSYKSKSA
ncbi:tetraprenyl-beta-curcumene synthase family protein [Alkalibacillus silvisoli]|uniref:Tetraprenyl-beta-curcumene synthase n=1 Tax=Alkalibacillus silvisoli TaxID=392823 RepID=A0ABN1A156_9BACI